MQRRLDNSNKMEIQDPQTTSSTEVTSTDPLMMCIDNTPIEELLGSVTTYNNSESDTPGGKGQQLRTSARVIKKLKLDSVQALPTLQEKEKKEPVKEEKPEAKKPFRPLWSQEDKNLFFEALNEYGKDFDAIHLHISTKFKKKGLPEYMIKTRDQIRHLYYRTWHKVCKHLKLSDDIKKPAQELYALINYGEMRKKLGAVSEKTCFKLNELIYRGTVSIKSKGKTIRIKTPMCRALRKLNQLDENHDDLKLPTRVTVELRPADMETWLHVQSMAQNPRVRIVLPLQRRVSNLINCMSARWKTQIAEAHEKVVDSVNAVTSDSVPDVQITDEQKARLNPILRISPPPDSNIELPTINLSEYWTSHRICLNAYEERIGVKVPGEILWQSMCASFKGGGKSGSKKGGTKRSRHESTGEKAILNAQANAQRYNQGAAALAPLLPQPPPIDDTSALMSPPPLPSDTQSVHTQTIISCSSSAPTASSSSSDGVSTVSDVVQEAVNTILALQNNVSAEMTAAAAACEAEVAAAAAATAAAMESALKTDAATPDGATVHKSEPPVDEMAQAQEEQAEREKELIAIKKGLEVQRIKSGWTLANCGNLTVGELYLMFGTNSKVILEYSWDDLSPIILTQQQSVSASTPSGGGASVTVTDVPATADASVATTTAAAASTSSKAASDNATVINTPAAAPPPPPAAAAAGQKPEPTKAITSTLQRLLSIAKLHYRKNIIHCPCGHVCGSPNKNNCYRTNNKTLNSLNEKHSDVNFNAEYTIGNPIQPKIRQPPINSVFRTPPILPAPTTEAFRQQLDSIQRMRPRFCNRRGRPRGKQVVVERKLPLLPKPLLNGHSIVTMKVISQDVNDFKPKLRNIAPKSAAAALTSDAPPTKGPAVVKVCPDSINADKELVIMEPSPAAAAMANQRAGADVGNVLEEPQRVSSPTSISNLLDLALPSDDIILPNSDGYCRTAAKENVTSFAGFLSQDIEDSTPPSSPSRILKENENHWLNSEVADFSLSSFLGHLESPLKPQTTATSNDDVRLSQDVDAQLQSLLIESSIDYMAKFADLAAQVAADSTKK